MQRGSEIFEKSAAALHRDAETLGGARAVQLLVHEVGRRELQLALDEAFEHAAALEVLLDLRAVPVFEAGSVFDVAFHGLPLGSVGRGGEGFENFASASHGAQRYAS